MAFGPNDEPQIVFTVTFPRSAEVLFEQLVTCDHDKALELAHTIADLAIFEVEGGKDRPGINRITSRDDFERLLMSLRKEPK